MRPDQLAQCMKAVPQVAQARPACQWVSTLLSAPAPHFSRRPANQRWLEDGWFFAPGGGVTHGRLLQSWEGRATFTIKALTRCFS
jgi:hypothetical protein